MTARRPADRYRRRGRGAGLHPLQTGHQHLLEQLRVKISDSELEQAASDGQRCGMRIAGCPAVAW